MSSAAAAPFAVGDRVRLARPENPTHPRRGRVGTVVRTRWFDEEVRRGKLVANGCWMVTVRFDPVEKVDGLDKLGVGAVWVCFDGELASEKGGTTA